MIHYNLSCKHRLSQLIHVKVVFKQVEASNLIRLQLAAWRPGRYEFQHFARNITNIKAYGPEEKPLIIQKTARNVWEISTVPAGDIRVEYDYSCTQLDAGGSWIDDQLLYVNPINCLLYFPDHLDVPCQLHLDFEDLNSISPASSLSFKKGIAHCSNFFELADSPFFISQQQDHDEYTVKGYRFHLWTHGTIAYDKAVLKQHFIAFTEAQIDSMGVFPEKEYHFLLLLFPFQHYHGVEHHRSTVITLGPSQELNERALYQELISISSHELYHAWNICKIRPQELLPYRLEEENYFRTGFVAEGITSYLGEYFLRKSNFFSRKDFLKEIEQWFLRHRTHRGLKRASLSDSSFDLWVDGYTPNAVDYKVSIYVAGALAAIALDLKIRWSHPEKSIHDLMRTLYTNTAQQNMGYTPEVLQQNMADLIGKKASAEFWETCIEGQGIDEYVSSLLHEFGVAVNAVPSALRHERLFGIKLKPGQNKPEIAKVQVLSPAASQLMPDDLILSVDGINISNTTGLEEQLTGKTQATFYVLRKGRELEAELTSNENTYWDKVSVQKNSEASEEQKLRYKSWLGSNA